MEDPQRVRVRALSLGVAFLPLFLGRSRRNKSFAGRVLVKRIPMPLGLAAMVLALTLVLIVIPDLRAESQAEEYRVKAAYLYHFAQLVDWPAEALNRDDRSIFVCTYGDDAFHGALETTIEGKTIGTRALRIRHIHPKESTKGCQMLFIGKGESKRVPALLAALRDSPIVTVGEEDNFLQQGGVISFCLEDSKIRFEVNLRAAESARVKISSRLLLFAKSVVGSAGAR